MSHGLSTTSWPAPDADWLTDEPGAPPRSENVICYADQVAEWSRVYASELGITDPGTSSRLRLWSCWAHHWRTAADRAARRCEPPPSVWEVASQIESGKGYTGNGNLGGNVLRDVVLAAGLLHKDGAAVQRFQGDYRHAITRQVSSVRGGLTSSDEWWNDLLGALIGLDTQPRLLRYSGKSGLVPWVVTVAVRFLADRQCPRLTRSLDAAGAIVVGGRAGGLQAVVAADCLAILSGRIQAAVAALRPRERLALKLSVVHGMKGQAIARLFRIDPGNVSRLLHSARDSVWAHMSAHPNGAAENRECLAAVIDGGQVTSLADVLRLALEESDAKPRSS